MANVDVSELMADPDFVDPIQVVVRTAAVSSFGENFIEERIIATVGSIQPADYRTIQRLPEALRNEDVSSFFVRGKIPTVENCRYPSILVFEGRRYEIRQLADWSNFGEGYSEGICVVEKPA